MSGLICQMCGSSRVRTLVESQVGQLTLGPDFEFQGLVHECEDCGERGDFSGEGEAKYLEALKLAQKALQRSIIEDLGGMGFSMAYVERAFELPPRTLARWKSGDLSAANLALLRIIKSMPWIVDVAFENFDEAKMLSRMGRFVFERFQAIFEKNNVLTVPERESFGESRVKYSVSLVDQGQVKKENEIVADASGVELAG